MKPEAKEQEYSVTLDCFIMDSVNVTAASKEEAIEKAMSESQYSDHELTVYEVSKV